MNGTFIEAFAGVGGFGLGLERAGWRCVGQIEIGKFQQRVLAKHWPDAPRWEDIATYYPEPGSADLLTGGFPCQDLSVAGKRAGLAGARSGLFFEFARVARELRPAWILLENVPGLLSSDGGRDFGVVIDTLGELGYGLAWRVLDARYFGVPQRRRRVFVVGRLGGPVPHEVLFEPEGGSGHPAEGGETGESVAGTLRGGARGADDPWRGRTYIPEVGRALTGTMGKRHDDDTDTLVAHTLRSSGFDASEDGTGRGTPMVIDEGYVPDIVGALDAGGADGDKAHGGAWQGYTAQGAAQGHLIAPLVLRMREGKEGGGKGPLLSEDASLTLAQANDQTLFQPMVTSGPKMFDGSGYHRESLSSEVTPTVSTYEQPMWVAPSVRRLTPTECERLMGWPDGHTCLCGCDPYSTEACSCPDGPRYAAIGNGVVANVVEWIARRIKAELRAVTPMQEAGALSGADWT